MVNALIRKIIQYNYRQAEIQAKKRYNTSSMSSVNHIYTLGYSHALNDLLECLGFDRIDHSNIALITDLGERVAILKGGVDMT